MAIIAKILVGSRLYGTYDKYSDYDFITIEMPSVESILMCNPLNTQVKVGKDDNRCFDLSTFVKQLAEGQTWAIECLFAPDQNLIYSTPLWNLIRLNFKIFLSKNVSSFVGFAASQARKYTIKGDRYNAITLVRGWFDNSDSDTTLATLRQDIANLIVNSISCNLVEPGMITISSSPTEEYLEVAGKKIQMSKTVNHARTMLNYLISNYGSRSVEAARNGRDWKSLSHAVRVCYEARSILADGKIRFPLAQSNLLRDIKSGAVSKFDVDELLEALIKDVYLFKEASLLPDSIDNTSVEEFLCRILREYIVDSELFEKQWLVQLWGRIKWSAC